MLDVLRLLARPWASTASGSTPCPTSSSAKAPTARTCPRPTPSCKRAARATSTSTTPARVLLAEANQWPDDVRRLLRRRRRVPHGLPLPADAAHLHGACAARSARRSSRSWRQHAGDPAELPVGHLPAQPRRADPGDGDRRRARLHVRASTPGPAHAAQPRHPPPAGAADGQRPPPDRAAATACCSRCPARPVLYYGDEIGMGDNIYLGDRNGVRTPMQWTGDRNAGFSRADPTQLYAAADRRPGLRLPGGQRRGPAARRRPRCCTGCKRLIALRKEHPVFGRGDLRPAAAREPADLRPPADLRRRRRSLRAQPRALRPSRRARPLRL